MGKWSEPAEWRRLCEGKCRGTIVELDAAYLTTQRDQPVRGYCCLVLKRRRVARP